MSVNTRSPLRVLGAVNLSGQLNDGAQSWTQGGLTTFSAFSGGLLTLGSGSAVPASNPGTGHAIIVSGPGRLNKFFPHQIASGVAAYFYDSNVAARSGVGTIPESGYAILGLIPANSIGSYALLGGGPGYTEGGIPFVNGLAVSAASGVPGFTVTYSPGNQSYVGP